MHWLTAPRTKGYWNAVKPLKIIHYCSNPKPWDSEGTKKKGELELSGGLSLFVVKRKVSIYFGGFECFFFSLMQNYIHTSQTTKLLNLLKFSLRFPILII